jgi:CRISPR-associated endonuclease/helicase Cas3
MTEKLYYKYWGKACADEGQDNSYHLLPYYCLDVAAVCVV